MATQTATPPKPAIARFWDGLLRVTIYASGIMIIILMVMIAFAVIIRYVFPRSGLNFGSVPDFAGYFQYALVLLGAAWVLKIKKHVRLDFIVTRFSRRTQLWIEIVTNGLALISYAIFVVVGFNATVKAFVNHDFLYKTINMPLGPLYAFIPFCLTLLCIQIGIDIYGRFKMLGKLPAKPAPPAPQAQPGPAVGKSA
jgi:TRAP-type C4-dicarboxylate transport system permease small subunit